MPSAQEQHSAAVSLQTLAVDDSRAARTLVSSMRKQLGFVVETAQHGQDALEKLADIETPHAFVSSESDPRRVASALLAGVDEYLFKPVDVPMLHERLSLMGVSGKKVS